MTSDETGSAPDYLDWLRAVELQLGGEGMLEKKEQTSRAALIKRYLKVKGKLCAGIRLHVGGGPALSVEILPSVAIY